MRLRDKVAIITGAAFGMGAEEARLFAREGATVIAADIQDEAGHNVVAEIRSEGGDAEYAHLDVTSEQEWKRLVEDVLSRHGRIDVLVNNAGISSTMFPDPLDFTGWQRIMDVNANGVYLGSASVIPAMQRAGKGSIVNISSIMGFVGGEGGHPAYHASKGAVRIFTKAMAVRYGPDGIRVNSVHPGFMPPMTTSRPDTPMRADQIEHTPLRRIGQPIEVANGVLFLASDEASFITGTELVIDGGFIAR
jgi:NAD(P)-dependent dehydrogenase (short-subunit alcohol dehydrogenase family)